MSIRHTTIRCILAETLTIVPDLLRMYDKKNYLTIPSAP
ncbi:hypothetical protein DSUL_60121 [Desulfovibrionales bacterium]